MVKITEFTTEFEKNPIGIEENAPRFCWKYGQADNLVQTSYIIRVSSDREKLINGVGDVWDSGKTESDDNLCIVYGGEPLKACSVYYVKVYVETNLGNAESDINTFETGLCGESGKLSFRTLPYTANGAAIAFRRDFSLPAKKVERARAYVCALGYHEFYFNGEKIGTELLNPAVTDYNKLYYYNTYDITDRIREKNGAGILAADGWNGICQICAVFYVKFADGEERFIKTGEYERAWKAKKSPIVFTSVFDGETFDARLKDEFKSWSEYNPGYNLNNGWYYAAVKTHDEKISVKPQRVESIKKQGSVVPTGVYGTEKAKIYDFGEILTGRCRITVKGERGARVIIRHCEVLSENGEPNFKSMRNAANKDEYILAGEETETWSATFSYRGFRYAVVTVCGNAEILEIIAEKIRTDNQTVGSFVCSDETLNALHEAAVRTEACNQHGILTDCPQRDERMGWINDLTTRLYQTVNNFGMQRFFEKIADDVTLTMNSDGAIKDTAPYYIGGEVADPVGISYLLLAKFSYERYGNLTLLKKNYPYYKKWVNYLIANSKNGILTLGTYGDWVPAIRVVQGDARKNKSVPIPVISTAYLFWYCKLTAEFARLLGFKEDTAFYSDFADKTKKAFNAEFYDERNKSYCADVQAMNAISVSIGLCEEKNKTELVRAIVRDVKERGYHMTCGNQSYRHLFDVLAENGYNDVIVKILKNEEYPSFSYMLKNGATTIWERWEKDVSETEENMHSYCHPMFTAYDRWFFRYVAGIRVIDGVKGMRQTEIAPEYIEGLTDFRCSYETPNGRIAVDCDVRGGGDIVYKIEIPPNMTAKIKIPFADKTFNVTSGKYVYETRADGKT